MSSSGSRVVAKAPPVRYSRWADLGMHARTIKLVVVLAVVASVGVWVWRQTVAEPLSEFRDFPYTYITEAAAGYDETQVIISRGEIVGPPQVETDKGAIAWPIYIHPDANVIPRQNGKPYLIPMITVGVSQHTPRIAPLGRMLTPSETSNLVRYQTTEGEERMAKFRKDMGQ